MEGLRDHILELMRDNHSPLYQDLIKRSWLDSFLDKQITMYHDRVKDLEPVLPPSGASEVAILEVLAPFDEDSALQFRNSSFYDKTANLVKIENSSKIVKKYSWSTTHDFLKMIKWSYDEIPFYLINNFSLFKEAFLKGLRIQGIDDNNTYRQIREMSLGETIGYLSDLPSSQNIQETEGFEDAPPHVVHSTIEDWISESDNQENSKYITSKP